MGLEPGAVSYRDAIAELERLSASEFGGSPNPEMVQLVRENADKAMRALPTPDCRINAKKLVNWVEIACSTTRWRGYGLEQVRDSARGQVFRLKRLALTS